MRWNDRPTLRPKEVAEIVGLSLTRVHQLIRESRLKKLKDGRASLITTASVAEYLREPPPHKQILHHAPRR